MSIEQILLDNTILKFMEVKIDDVVILQDEIASLEIKYSLFDLRVKGKLKFKDSFDIGNSGLVKISNDNKVTISVMDRGDTKSFRTYRVVNSNVIVVSDRVRMYDIDLQDEISWQLQNTFSNLTVTDGSAVEVFEHFMDSKYIQAVMRSDKLVLNAKDTSEVRTFTIPKNENVLDFLVTMLRKDNIRVYQDRKTIHVKEIVPSKIKPLLNYETGSDLVFTNDVSDNTYLFKIHEFRDFKNDTAAVNQIAPVIKVNSSVSPKEISTVTISLTEFFKDLQLNDMDLGSIQLTNGEKLETSEELAVGWQKARLFDTFMLNQQMYAAVKGTLLYSEVGKVVTTKMKGSIAGNDTNLEGDRLTSGKYLVLGVSDRYLGDKLIQRLHLGRLDAQKVREKK